MFIAVVCRRALPIWNLSLSDRKRADRAHEVRAAGVRIFPQSLCHVADLDPHRIAWTSQVSRHMGW